MLRSSCLPPWFPHAVSRPYGTLVVAQPDPQAGTIGILVATTRAPVTEPPGVMFGGSRGLGLDFANIVVSIPPGRAPGEMRGPPAAPPIRRAISQSSRSDRMTLAEAKASFDQRVKAVPGRRVLVFVHGFNTRFEEAVYRFAQIAYDSNVKVAPVLFTWPSGGGVLDYVYDRDSAIYSRDALEKVLQTIADDPNVGAVAVLGHSMGAYLVVEALRQMSIRNHGLPRKIGNVMLASPDIDVDVFRRQIAAIDAAPRTTNFTIFVSRDDRALSLSILVAHIQHDWARSIRPRSLIPRCWRSRASVSSIFPACVGRRHRPQQIRQRRRGAGDRGEAGVGPAQRPPDGRRRIPRLLYRRRHWPRGWRGGRRRRRAGHADRSDLAREVGRDDARQRRARKCERRDEVTPKSACDPRLGTSSHVNCCRPWRSP